MAHIKKFTIDGLAGRSEKVEKTLDRHTNVFFGVNGSGKTSLLRILSSAMTGDATTIANVPFRTASVHIYSEDLKAVFERTVNRSDIITDEDPKSERLKKHDGPLAGLFTELTGENRRTHRSVPATARWKDVTALPPAAPLRWSHVFLPISRMFPSIQRSAMLDLAAFPTGSKIADDEFLNQSFAENLTEIWRRYNATVDEKVRKAQGQGLSNILQAMFSPPTSLSSERTMEIPTAYKRLQSFLERQGEQKTLPDFQQFSETFGQDARIRRVVSDIDEVELGISYAQEPTRRLTELVNRLFSGGKTLSFAGGEIEVQTGADQRLSPGHLSSGEKQVLRILV
ncbi:MAG: ATP-binding protein, partial [Micropepsaceae bacterium]